ncbi:helix-turn-helix transcriptional regulator [Flavobacterium sp. 17A]|uniref:Helix-turn-helix transcriptional regulator n=1 Tax=Flavobacterium potami TaxID=2872310 RepID=A0A9X1HCQ8_9FLAO|nr:AraC family transcriptional regulator [Flavobacterium potami]MBZ4036710.1 helix-turn-helix transcriptional regulator [Flavobacterium potami]
METSNNKQWLTDLKVLYLAGYKKLRIYDVFSSPGWFTVIIVVSGSAAFTCGGSSIVLSTGDMCVVPQGSELTSLSGPLRICLLSCTVDFAVSSRAVRFGSPCIEALVSQAVVVLPLTPSEMRHMIQLIKLLKKKIFARDTLFQDEMVLLCLHLIFYEFCGLYYKNGQDTALLYSRNDKTASNFIMLVHQHCKVHHEIKFYADSLFVSQGHLRKTVRGVLGTSAKHFIEMAVIAEAYLLLADENLSIAQIAENLNFKDSSSFSHFFKRHTRLSPSQYRLNLKF